MPEGWQIWKHQTQRVFHYIGDDGRSLCGRLGFYRAELQPANPAAPRGREDCAECYRRLQRRMLRG